ncbi:MAG: hypothetical protein AAGD07_23490 [Planctomycetota bacterium]
MTRFRILFLLLSVLGATLPGCGGGGNEVIEPGEGYQLTEQEQANRERAEKLLAEQRQQ